MKPITVFVVALLVTLAVVSGVVFIYLGLNRQPIQVVDVVPETTEMASTTSGAIALDDDVDMAALDRLPKLVAVSKRLNVLMMGTDGGRADTIIVASYDPITKLLDFVTVPRDTYNKVPGHNGLGQKKINAVYGFGKRDGGSLGMKSQVSAMLKIPIRYYVTVDYKALATIVDLIDGVDVSVERHMKYDDPTATPPLHIDIPAGEQHLNGQTAVEYLRWRKNNGEDGSDIDRTGRQIDFVKRAIAKTIRQFQLVEVLRAGFDQLDTNMPLSEMVYYASTVVGFNPESDIATHRIPGKVVFTDLSYYMHDEAATEAMLIAIYQRGYRDDNDASTTDDNGDGDEN